MTGKKNSKQRKDYDQSHQGRGDRSYLGRVKHKAMIKHYLGTHITERQKEIEVHADMKFNFFENSSLLRLGIVP